MSNYAKADTKTQSFKTRYPGSKMNLTEKTMVLVLHTTEGPNWPGYNGGATAPNYTGQPPVGNLKDAWRAHFPDEMSSRALENRAGGVQTNTQNAVQVELIGTCDPKNAVSWGGKGKVLAGKHYVYWPKANDAQLKWLADFVKDMHDRHGLKLISPAKFNAYPASYGKTNDRLTFDEWNKVTGIIGHQHIPENSHGDPGYINIDKIISYAKGSTVTPTPITPKDPVVGAASYVVVPGDTLYSIAKKHNVSLDDLKKWNNLSENLLKIGMVLAVKSNSTPGVTPPDKGYDVEFYSQNLAGYDKVYGLKTAESRANNQIPKYLDKHSPDWFHFQECSASMLEAMNSYMKGRGYIRVPQGGKGRQSYYAGNKGIEVLAAGLKNVTHMLRKDTKEFLAIVSEYPGGYKDVQLNFHNENEGSTFQILQLRDVMKEGLAVAKRHNVPLKNLVLTGDSNLKLAVTAIKTIVGWTTATVSAKKKIDLIYKTTNAWAKRVTPGQPIDIDVVRTDATVLESEMHFGSVISDHWGRRTVRRLFLK